MKDHTQHIEIKDHTRHIEIKDNTPHIEIKDNTQHIEIKGNVPSVVTADRKIPLALKPKLEKESTCMVDLDITATVQKPTD